MREHEGDGGYVGDGGVWIRLSWRLRALAGAFRPEMVDILAVGGEDLRLNTANLEKKLVRTP